MEIRTRPPTGREKLTERVRDWKGSNDLFDTHLEGSLSMTNLVAHETSARTPNRALTALAVACGIAFVATGALAADAKVKVGSSQTLGEGPFYVAMDKGYFRDEGLDVEMVAVRVGPDALSAVAAGEIDVVNAVPES